MGRKKRFRLYVGKRFISLKLGSAAFGQPGNAATCVLRVRHRVDETFLFQTAQQTAHQAGVETEIIADNRNIRLSPAD
uniref:Uncharacterized protein n=1 Tax=Rhizobium leguminosarum TaxID=384 RepID=A0A179BM97_RHILE|nr:hypothetical protein A4U53_40115 [Rhizobium leguminosarum]